MLLLHLLNVVFCAEASFCVLCGCILYGRMWLDCVVAGILLCQFCCNTDDQVCEQNGESGYTWCLL